MDLKWLLSADDKASPVFDKVKKAGTEAANGISGVFDGLVSKFNLLPGAIGALTAVAAGGAFTAIIKSTVDWDLSVYKLSVTLGIGLEQASIFSIAMHSVGVDQDTATTAAMRLAKAMTTHEQLFRDLGVSVRDSNGNYRDSMSVMLDVNSKLANLKGGFDRNTIAMQLYGRGWAEIMPLMKVTSEKMDEARETAERLHLIVGPEGVAQSLKYKQGLAELELVGKSLSIQFGTVLLPWLIKIGAYLGQNAPILVDTFRHALDFFSKTFSTIGEWLGLMAFRFYSFGAIVKDALTGNFGEIKQDWANMVAAGDDFSKKTKDSWSDWALPTHKASAPVNTGPEAPIEDIDGILKKMKGDLTSYQANETAKTAVAKEQAGIRELQEKNQYDRGLVTAKDYFTQIQQYALDAAQSKFQDAEEYLGKESTLLEYIAAKKGKDSDEYVAESGKHQKSIEAVQSAELGYAKIYLDGEEKMRLALKSRTDEYAKFEQQTLQNAGEYVAAAQQQQRIDSESIDSLRLKKEAEEGVAGAVNSLAAVEQKRAIDLVTAQNKEHDAAAQYAADIAKMTAEIALLNGADKIQLDAEGKLRDGIAIETKMRDELALVTVKGDALAIAGMNSKISLQDVLNQRLQNELDLIQRKGVLTGSIVGFNGNTPIYADGYSKNQTANGYVNNGTLTGTGVSPNITSIHNSPFVSINDPFTGYLPSYDVGTPYVPRTGPAIIHRGERIIPAADNTSGSYGGMTISGGIQITVQGGDSSAATVDEIARQLMPKLDELARRRRAA